MTKATDGSMRVDTKDIVRHPIPYVLLILGLGGGGIGGATLLPFASKEDFRRLESKVDIVQRDVNDLLLDKRAREWIDSRRVTLHETPKQ